MPRLSIVVAVKDGDSNVQPLLNALACRDTETEIIMCSAGPAPAVEPGANLITMSLGPQSLIPSLWSAGIARARGAAVALTTAQFVPRADWLERLHAADLKHWAGVGGAVDNDPNASALNWAIFFLRYSAFAPPLRPGECHEIAADNAIYDCAAIMEHPNLLKDGFWEPSFHRRFRAGGRKLMLDPHLVVIHHGTVSARSFARQRYLHGRAYGTERSERGSIVRNLLLLLLSPLVTPLLLARVILRIAKRPAYRRKLLPAFPWLVRFAVAWTVGEAAGYLSTLARSGAATPPLGRRGVLNDIEG